MAHIMTGLIKIYGHNNKFEKKNKKNPIRPKYFDREAGDSVDAHFAASD